MRECIYIVVEVWTADVPRGKHHGPDERHSERRRRDDEEHDNTATRGPPVLRRPACIALVTTAVSH